jgi:hypothetical protein
MVGAMTSPPAREEEPEIALARAEERIRELEVALRADRTARIAVIEVLRRKIAVAEERAREAAVAARAAELALTEAREAADGVGPDTLIDRGP